MRKRPHQPSNGEVHLWVCRGFLKEGLERGEEFLALDERMRIRQLHCEEDQRRLSGGLLLQRVILAHYLGCGAAECMFSRNEWGKPSVVGTSMEFSLSRSHEMAVLAVVDGGRVGVDVEWVRDCDPQIADQFSGGEREKVANAENPMRVIFDLWTRKEAYLKGLGKGLSHPLAEFEALNGQVRDWSKDAPYESWWVESLSLAAEDYAAAVAVDFPISSLSPFEIKLGDLLSGCL